MAQLWRWLLHQGGAASSLLALSAWAIVPTQSNALVVPCRTAQSTLVLPPLNDEDWSSCLKQALVKLGCDIVNTVALGSPAVAVLAEVTAHPANGIGILRALQNSLSRVHMTPQQWFESASLLPAEREGLLQLLVQKRWFSGVRHSMPPEQIQFLRSLPIFPAAGLDASFRDLDQVQRFLPPSDVHASFVACESLFVHSAMLASRGREIDAVLLDHLGVRQLSKPQFYKKFVLPELHALESIASEAIAVQILREVPVLQQSDDSILDDLRAAPLVTTAGGGNARPDQIYDPRNADLLSILDPGDSFPSGTFGPVLDQLCILGMRVSADRDTIIQAARRVQELAEGDDPMLATSRSCALLAYLDAHAAELQTRKGLECAADRGRGFQLDAVFSRVANMLTGEAVRETENLKGEDAAEFWKALRSISWCPVLKTAPLEGMSWYATMIHGTTAEPAVMRPRTDLWLASAQRCILNGDVRSSVLLQAMGWDSPLPPACLAKQLAALGVAFGQVVDTSTRQLLAEITPQLYRALARLPAEGLASVRKDLGDAPCIWIGDGFAPVSNVALKGPLNLSSAGIYVIPLELAPFKDVLLALGIPSSFSATQYISILASMNANIPGKSLDDASLEQALGVAAALADMSIPAGAALYLPDERGMLRDVRELLYNDAPWAETGPPLEGSTFVHPVISNDVADRLGVASVRRVLLAQGADALPMALTGAAVEAFGQSEALTTRLRHILESYADGPGALMELMQNADDAGATSARFMLDRSEYPADRLLGPKLAAWQGPALIAWNDAVFTAADVQNIARIGQDSKLTRPGATGRFGLGFNSVFHWTGKLHYVAIIK